MNIQTIEGLGYKILITEYITKDVQRRTHKKKRINKKWLKRYGMKIVPDNTKILLVNNTLMMTEKCYEKLRKFTDKDADSMEKFLKKVTKKQSQEWSISFEFLNDKERINT